MNPFIDHLVILSSYLVVKVKCVIGLVASQQARLKGSIKMVTSRVRVSTFRVLIRAEMLFTAIKYTQEKTTKKEEKGEKNI